MTLGANAPDLTYPETVLDPDTGLWLIENFTRLQAAAELIEATIPELSAFIQTLVDDASAAVARSTLGVPRLAEASVLCPHSRLRATYVTASTVDIDADGLVLTDTDGNQRYFENINLTVDISTTGANGRNATENSGNEKASDWYHLWVIAKADGTVAAWAALDDFPGSGTDVYADLPTDYIFAGYVGACRNDGSSNLEALYQRGNFAMGNTSQLLTNGAATSATAISANCPDSARTMLGYMAASSSDSAGCAMSLTPTSNQMGLRYLYNIGGSANANWTPVEVGIVTPNTLYYLVAGTANARGNLIRTGWRY